MYIRTPYTAPYAVAPPRATSQHRVSESVLCSAALYCIYIRTPYTPAGTCRASSSGATSQYTLSIKCSRSAVSCALPRLRASPSAHRNESLKRSGNRAFVQLARMSAAFASSSCVCVCVYVCVYVHDLSLQCGGNRTFVKFARLSAMGWLR